MEHFKIKNRQSIVWLIAHSFECEENSFEVNRAIIVDGKFPGKNLFAEIQNVDGPLEFVAIDFTENEKFIPNVADQYSVETGDTHLNYGKSVAVETFSKFLECHDIINFGI
jgi:hypothetical protein